MNLYKLLDYKIACYFDVRSKTEQTLYASVKQQTKTGNDRAISVIRFEYKNHIIILFAQQKDRLNL